MRAFGEAPGALGLGGFANLVHSYGLLETIAGNGTGGTDGTNYWRSVYEGGYATNAALSRPHFVLQRLPVAGATSSDFIHLQIEDSLGTKVYETDDPGKPTRMDGAAPNGCLYRR